MSDFDPHITIDERTDAKDVICTVKELTIDSHRLKLETPVKVLSGKAITCKTADELLGNTETPIFELTKVYDLPKYYDNLMGTLEHGGNTDDWTKTLDNTNGLRQTLQNKYRKNLTSSVVFQYYPLNNVEVRNCKKACPRMSPELYHNYLDYIYTLSTAFILTPDVNLPTQKQRQISLKEYLDFIEYSVEAFERHNNKPIFVPLQIDFANEDLRQTLAFYREKGYTNIWINFKAKACNGSNAGKLRVISRLIEEEYIGKDAVIYSSQIKRERDVKRSTVPALDMLPPFISADFVGINRTHPARGGNLEVTAQRKGFGSIQELEDAQNMVKKSLFNPVTYDYCLPSVYPRSLLPEKINDNISKNTETTDFINGILIGNELSVIREMISEDKEILPYLQTKEGVKNNMAVFGNASKVKSTPGRLTDLLDFF